MSADEPPEGWIHFLYSPTEADLLFGMEAPLITDN
jgi:hypothetical protein